MADRATQIAYPGNRPAQSAAELAADMVEDVGVRFEVEVGRGSHHSEDPVVQPLIIGQTAARKRLATPRAGRDEHRGLSSQQIPQIAEEILIKPSQNGRKVGKPRHSDRAPGGRFRRLPCEKDLNKEETSCANCVRGDKGRVVVRRDRLVDMEDSMRSCGWFVTRLPTRRIRRGATGGGLRARAVLGSRSASTIGGGWCELDRCLGRLRG
jgi:hypothetical protein